jgi:hypothetical protein
VRTVVMPGGPTRSLLREWERFGGRLSAMWHYASRSNAFHREVSGPLPELIEALAPLGMPDERFRACRTVPAIGSVGTFQRGVNMKDVSATLAPLWRASSPSPPSG